jgi:hypothetical protein
MHPTDALTNIAIATVNTQKEMRKRTGTVQPGSAYKHSPNMSL